MKPGMKLTIFLCGGIFVWCLIGYFIFRCGTRSEKPEEIAKIALLASVDKPESVKILGISKPDSIFGRDYVNDDEKMAIAVAMMRINEKVMEKTGGFEFMDFENPEITDLMERQMSATSLLRSFMPLSPESQANKTFNGWKVKIEYEAESLSGSPYHSEYWFILDKNARCVVKSFEIPLI